MTTSQSKVIRINLYAGPGVGKSTTAARLFSDLKIRWNQKNDPQVELITEAIKEWAWLKLPPQSWDQFFIFASQLRREDIVLRHKHTSVVTDSPLWMQLGYIKRGNSPFYGACVTAARLFDEQFESFNAFLLRSVPYHQEGRYENPDQAVEMDNLIRSTLAENGVLSQEYNPVTEYDRLFGDVVKYIEGKHTCPQNCSTENPLPNESKMTLLPKLSVSGFVRNSLSFLSGLIPRPWST
jgi:hypothetical protein